MRKIGDVLRLSAPGRSKRKIAGSHRPQPDWAAVHRELRRPGDASAVVGGASRRLSRRLRLYSRYSSAIASWERAVAVGRGSKLIISQRPTTRSWIVLSTTLTRRSSTARQRPEQVGRDPSE
jgi:hypothetical protein